MEVVMGFEQGALALEVTASSDIDPEELAALVRRLRGELLELDVDTVVPLTAGEAPDGAKGVELLAIGGLLIEFVLQPEMLSSIIKGVQSWLRRQSEHSVKLTLDGDSIEVTGVSSEQQNRLIDLWVARHAPAP
jgi:hypothetical protein